MSSTTSAAAAASAAATAALERQTYWCYDCVMNVSLLPPSSSSLLCPQCGGDFLEQLDSPLFNPNSSPDPSLSQVPFPMDSPFLSPHQTPTATTPPASDENYLLDSPYLHRLIQQIANSESQNPSPFLATTARCLSPASKAAVEAIPTIKITASLLELDPILLCAVCKDQFVIDDESKQLPCKHMYHPDCILPWLSQHNSCPVCRFRLPTENNLSRERRRSRLSAVRFRDLMMESTLRHIARRHELVFPDQRQSGVEESLLSPTQVGEAESGLVERSNSVETVSSWPRWPVEGAVNMGGGGNGDIGVSARVNDEEGDTVVSWS